MRLAHRHRPDAGLEGALRHMTVPDQTPAAIIRHQMGVSRKGLGDLRFDGLRQKGTRSVA
jgi:hypothetical protein